MPYRDKEYAKSYDRRRKVKQREESPGYRERMKVDRKMFHLKKFGLTKDDFDKLLDQQGGGCACCGRKMNAVKGRRFAVDHDHKTGKVRGLLCHNCNLGIGQLGDDLDGVLRAVDYLRRSQSSDQTGR